MKNIILGWLHLSHEIRHLYATTNDLHIIKIYPYIYTTTCIRDTWKVPTYIFLHVIVHKGRHDTFGYGWFFKCMIMSFYIAFWKAHKYAWAFFLCVSLWAGDKRTSCYVVLLWMVWKKGVIFPHFFACCVREWILNERNKGTCWYNGEIRCICIQIGLSEDEKFQWMINYVTVDRFLARANSMENVGHY